MHLHLLGHQALERIRSLEASGQTHAAQKHQLEQKAEVAQRSITALEEAKAQNVEDLARLQQQAVASQERLVLLKAAVDQTTAQLGTPNREANLEKRTC